MNEPLRTCVGCREKATAPTLLRVVAVDGSVVPDPRRRLPGRGAWLHPILGCLDLAERRRAFGRAFRRPSERFDTTEVRQVLIEQPEVPSTPKAGRPVVSMP
ncbi:YlxR family protein [Nakamurella sp. UYEF19]|uniref:YlxR family protein n=1 Tax=Nakamurella sp. UYEF19 TaxID=1756392 RepID=UPI003396CB05